jgi:hypothetical protein
MAAFEMGRRGTRAARSQVTGLGSSSGSGRPNARSEARRAPVRATAFHRSSGWSRSSTPHRDEHDLVVPPRRCTLDFAQGRPSIAPVLSRPRRYCRHLRREPIARELLGGLVRCLPRHRQATPTYGHATTHYGRLCGRGVHAVRPPRLGLRSRPAADPAPTSCVTGVSGWAR